MRRWLADPFRYVAGVQALVLGLAALVLTAVIASFAGVHFDGVVDAHYGAPSTFVFIFAEGVLNATLLTAVLTPLALLIGRPGLRLIDLLGTQLLARAPFLLVALIMLVYPWLVELPDWLSLSQSGDTPSPAQTVALLGLAALTLPPIVWSVYLMYRSFSTCADVRGGKAIAGFVIALIAAELLSKLIYLRWFGASTVT